MGCLQRVPPVDIFLCGGMSDAFVKHPERRELYVRKVPDAVRVSVLFFSVIYVFAIWGVSLYDEVLITEPTILSLRETEWYELRYSLNFETFGQAMLCTCCHPHLVP